MEASDPPQESNTGTEGADVVDVLSDPVRRRIVEHLRERDGEGIRLLTIHVTRSEADRRGSTIPEIGHDQMQWEIEEEHLPALIDAGLVTYNYDTEWIEMNGHDDEILDRLLGDD